MKIHCTVFRKNGTYETVRVKASAEEFELDGKKYDVKHYYIGKIGNVIHILRALYFEGYPLPISVSIEEEFAKKNVKRDVDSKKAPFRIDCRAIKNMTNKKILNVFGDEELTKLEKLLIVVAVAIGAIGVINTVLLFSVMNALGL